ncbi:hypothetical protein HN51_055008 [Arachis hypogaea]|uniref:Glabrous enhancer-binding protein-like DBD domain-containing protein n=1 Tax=Arachis hypogaea TaxID=3818 RepID=A0A444XMN5_ARAHY|nr:probable transcription factor At5g28040 [Arachis ipaensis]QHN77642.1 uncharacterized protein DS421_19g654470 [Arachis hypogaea]RYQ90865.1 hypothetical protein Ahy_B09g096827 [Arachis hypogaea]
MLSPFVSWLLSSTTSSSSSSSSDEQEQSIDIDDTSTDQPDPENDIVNDQNDNNHQTNGDENDEHFLSSCDGDDAIPVALAVPATEPSPSPAVTVAFTTADDRIPVATTAAATTIVTQSKRQRAANYAGMIRQYQRLWTKQDEIELLRGYLEYVRRNKGVRKSLQNDVASFYGDVCHKLNVDFNKNQLVEKLRRLKRKHKVTLDKGNLGKVSFRNPQDETIFEISHKIWGKDIDTDQLVEEEEEEEEAFDMDGGGVDDDHGKVKLKVEKVVSCDEIEKRAPKRPRLSKNRDETATAADMQIQSFIEETMRSCFSPLIKELLDDEGRSKPVEFSPSLGDEGDEQWRKQRISELEVYLNRLELLQDQIKAKLEELRSGSRN